MNREQLKVRLRDRNDHTAKGAVWEAVDAAPMEYELWDGPDLVGPGLFNTQTRFVSLHGTHLADVAERIGDARD
ncbi:hypothetical protein [Lacipirellula sp.]|uniref:hypothetical protein n=1 Tax=Lacipirellula sp. TaxID=2691419 RepID=UPI003D09D7CA